MKTYNFEHLAKDWIISYNPYSDLFQMYDNSFFLKEKSNRSIHKSRGVKVMFDKDTEKPVFLEVDKLYKNLGVEIDNLGKMDIIKLVKHYIGTYDR